MADVQTGHEAQVEETRLETFSYDNVISRNFLVATVIWGFVGMLVGLIASIQLYAPSLEWLPEPVADILYRFKYLVFSRIRPVHTNAVIFAFVGNGIFLGVYYSLQRLLKARMWSDALSAIHFWGWQLIIVAAAITLPAGFTTGAEYAELQWPIDIAIALIWVVFGVNMMMTIIKRRERHMYVSIWFYIASWLTVAVLHIFRSIEIPINMLDSYPIYAGVQDALVQWWYGHNAVAFFLTTPYLGLMYYFMPKAANRPVYSYKLSIIHFWSLIFIYIWAGPHHLLYTSLPDWAQHIGMVFSLMLIAPSWGGMLNGLLTLRGVWDKVREDPILKFMVVAVTAYGMSTFEGPMLSIKYLNALSHYTDWTIGHVHIGAMGWNGFLTFGVLYWLVPRMWGSKLHSKKMAEYHFWIGMIGIILYAVPMYWAGITQGVMWKQFTADGTLLYPNFLETVTQIMPMYILRSIGGLFYLIGVIMMMMNLWKTAKAGKLIREETYKAPALAKEYKAHAGEGKLRFLERKPMTMLAGVTVLILIGGLVETIPMYVIKSNVPTISSVQPYTPLELEGRDIYVREGCYVCHSQMIRPFRAETERYGEYSKSGEFVYDRPFQWGSKRLGPDLHRIGAKYPDAWHYEHMRDPTSMSPGSIMPAYPWMITDDLDYSSIESKINVSRMLGTPYPEGYDEVAAEDIMIQARQIADNLKSQGIDVEPQKEIIAMIAYLQRMGTDIKGDPKSTAGMFK